MNQVFFLLTLWLTKLLISLISFFRLGQASNLPGKIALKFKKDILRDFILKEGCKVVYVTGTNGKSTTTGLLVSILRSSSKTVITNSAGANLKTGIISTLSKHSSFLGKLNADFLILEADEATLPIVTSEFKSDYILVTNFFRDQLDRFGELDTTVKLIEKGIENSESAVIILNADDPRVAFLNIGSNHKKIYYGIGCKDSKYSFSEESAKNISLWMQDPEEVSNCPKCDSKLSFQRKYLAHLGEYSCKNCNLIRPDLDFMVPEIKTDKLSIYFNLIELKNNSQKTNFFLPMIGIFNLYNAIASIALAKTLLNVTQVQIQKGFQSYSTIFGRGEKISVKNKTAWVYLIKNPTGTTEVLKTLSTVPNSRFLIAINDNYADGRDVSWLWDAGFEVLSNSKKEIFVSGRRAYDMALRLKYANVKNDLIKANEKISTTIDQALNSLSDEETLYILPTYTVLLEMQRKKVCKGT